jgi:ribosomal protein L14
MSKINSSSNTNETVEAGQGIIELSKKHPITEDAYFTDKFEEFSAKLNELIEKINAGWLNSELKEKDDARDLDVRAIFYEVEAKCMRRPGANQEKAMRVMDVLNRYGMQITDSSYTNESAQIRAMLSDFKAPELQDCIASIRDLKNLLDNAEESMAEFDASASKLIEDKNERENTKPASAVAREVREIYNNDLAGYLSAMTKANPAKYKTYTDLVNTLVVNSNNKVRDRLAAIKRKKEKINSELN